MAYKTEIQVKVEGLADVKKLEETLARVNALQAKINDEVRLNLLIQGV